MTGLFMYGFAIPLGISVASVQSDLDELFTTRPPVDD